MPMISVTLPCIKIGTAIVFELASSTSCMLIKEFKIAAFATAGEILLTCIHTFFGVAEWGDMTQDR
jgi:hypothetical protein